MLSKVGAQISIRDVLAFERFEKEDRHRELDERGNQDAFVGMAGIEDLTIQSLDEDVPMPAGFVQDQVDERVQWDERSGCYRNCSLLRGGLIGEEGGWKRCALQWRRERDGRLRKLVVGDAACKQDHDSRNDRKCTGQAMGWVVGVSANRSVGICQVYWGVFGRGWNGRRGHRFLPNSFFEKTMGPEKIIPDCAGGIAGGRKRTALISRPGMVCEWAKVRCGLLRLRRHGQLPSAPRTGSGGHAHCGRSQPGSVRACGRG